MFIHLFSVFMMIILGVITGSVTIGIIVVTSIIFIVIITGIVFGIMMKRLLSHKNTKIPSTNIICSE